MKKLNASSDKSMEREASQAGNLWKAAEFIRQRGVDTRSSLDAEPTPLEIAGMTIGMIRRRKKITQLALSIRIGCEIEEILAIEAGMLPVGDYKDFVPKILKEMNLSNRQIKMFLHFIESI